MKCMLFICLTKKYRDITISKFALGDYNTMENENANNLVPWYIHKYLAITDHYTTTAHFVTTKFKTIDL